MKLKMKTALLVLMIFVLGGVVGFLGHGFMFKTMYEKRMTERGPMLFLRMYDRILEPTPEQKKQIDAILIKYADKIASQNFEFRQGMKSLLDELHLELEPLLTPEQHQAMQNHEERFKKGGPGFRRPFDRDGRMIPKERMDPRFRHKPGEFPSPGEMPPPPLPTKEDSVR